MPGGRPVHRDVRRPVPVVVPRNGQIARAAVLDGELVAHLPHAGRRMVDGDVCGPVAVIITGHRYVAPTAELRRELVAHLPVPGGRPVDRDVGQAIAVVVGDRPARRRGHRSQRSPTGCARTTRPSRAGRRRYRSCHSRRSPPEPARHRARRSASRTGHARTRIPVDGW